MLGEVGGVGLNGLGRMRVWCVFGKGLVSFGNRNGVNLFVGWEGNDMVLGDGDFGDIFVFEGNFWVGGIFVVVDILLN